MASSHRPELSQSEYVRTPAGHDHPLSPTLDRPHAFLDALDRLTVGQRRILPKHVDLAIGSPLSTCYPLDQVDRVVDASGRQADYASLWLEAGRRVFALDPPDPAFLERAEHPYREWAQHTAAALVVSDWLPDVAEGLELPLKVVTGSVPAGYYGPRHDRVLALLRRIPTLTPNAARQLAVAWWDPRWGPSSAWRAPDVANPRAMAASRLYNGLATRQEKARHQLVCALRRELMPTLPDLPKQVRAEAGMALEHAISALAATSAPADLVSEMTSPLATIGW